MRRWVDLGIVIAVGCGSGGGKPAADASPDGADGFVQLDGSIDAVEEPCEGNVIGSASVIDGPGAGAGNDGSFHSLVVHPTNPDIIYIGSEANGMFRSQDGGLTWMRLRDGLRHFVNDRYPEVWDIQIAPSNPDVLYAATVDSPGPTHGNFPSAVTGVYKSTDAGLTWRQVNCGLSTARAIAVEIDPTDADIATVAISAGVPSFGGAPLSFYDGGLFRTSNGGALWSAATMPAGYSNQSYWKSARRGGALITYAVASTPGGANKGFLNSVDEGATWTALAATPTDYVVNWDVSSDGMTFWVHEQGSFAIVRSTDGGQQFDELSVLSANGNVAVSPVDANIVLYTDIDRLYRTEDGFATTPPQIASTGATEIVFAPSDPQIVYLAVGLELYKSTNGGQTFSPLVNLRTEVLD